MCEIEISHKDKTAEILIRYARKRFPPYSLFTDNMGTMLLVGLDIMTCQAKLSMTMYSCKSLYNCNKKSTRVRFSLSATTGVLM